MRVETTVVGPAPVEAVRERLRSVGSWTWTHAQVVPADRGWWLRFDAPVPVAVRVQVDEQPDGVSLSLVEGDLAELSGQLHVKPADGGGSEVRLELDLAFPVVVPGTLLRELDGRVFPGWLAALVAAESPQAQ